MGDHWFKIYRWGILSMKEKNKFEKYLEKQKEKAEQDGKKMLSHGIF